PKRSDQREHRQHEQSLARTGQSHHTGGQNGGEDEQKLLGGGLCGVDGLPLLPLGEPRPQRTHDLVGGGAEQTGGQGQGNGHPPQRRRKQRQNGQSDPEHHSTQQNQTV